MWNEWNDSLPGLSGDSFSESPIIPQESELPMPLGSPTRDSNGSYIIRDEDLRLGESIEYFSQYLVRRGIPHEFTDGWPSGVIIAPDSIIWVRRHLERIAPGINWSDEAIFCDGATDGDTSEASGGSDGGADFE